MSSSHYSPRRWLAWYPIRTRDGEWKFMEWVQRRKTPYSSYWIYENDGYWTD